MLTLNFSAGIEARKFSQELTPFFEVVPWQIVQSRGVVLAEQASRHPIARSLVESDFELELGLARLTSKLRSASLSSKRVTALLLQHLRAAQFIAGVSRISQCLPAKSRHRLSRRIAGCMQSQHSLQSIELEIDTAIALNRIGLAPMLNDIDERGGFDFLATMSKGNVAIECKTFNADKGKRVHRKHVAQLGQVIAKKLSSRRIVPRCRAAVYCVEVKDRLIGSGSEIGALSRGLIEAARTGETVTCGEHGRVLFFDLSDSSAAIRHHLRNGNAAELAGLIERTTGVQNAHVISSDIRGESIYLMQFVSALPDRVRDSYCEEIYSACRQLSGADYGLVFCRLTGLTSLDILELHRLQQLQKHNLLQVVASEVFRRKTNEPAGIVFLPRPSMVERQPGVFRARLNAYTFFRDQSSPMSSELAMRLEMARTR